MRYKADRTFVLSAFFVGQTVSPTCTNPIRKPCMARNGIFITLRNPSVFPREGSVAKRNGVLQSPISPLHFAILILCLVWVLASPAYAVERVSLKKYPALSLQVPNPMETAKLQARQTFQVNHKEFVLQFFFNERDVFGYILKRNKSRPIHFRWCFFRSCEESAYDYKKVIAQAFNPPYDSGFFSIKFPAYLNYSFQGIEFSSPK
jgi:hypothetical protein